MGRINTQLPLVKRLTFSNIFQIGWYQWFYYRTNKDESQNPKKKPGKCLGTDKNEGNKIYRWVLMFKGNFVMRQYLFRLTPAELYPSNKSENRKYAEHDANTSWYMGELFRLPPNEINNIIVEDNEISVE